MKDLRSVHVVGGGPAGLLFALLLKGQRPSAEVVVHERRARDHTFGFGITFDRDLEYLRAADALFCERVEAKAEEWEQFAIVHKGARAIVRGGRFAGISRIVFLQLLQRRCQEVGVDLRFESRVDDPVGLASSCDLLVGADGAASAVRDAYRGALRPRVDLRTNRFAWYGTPHRFERLTLSLRPHETGLHIGHGYKYGPAGSTFIAACDEETWYRSGGDELPEAERRKLAEEVFRDDLEGQALISNRSRWVQFPMVKCERWWHENVVLLGDALHTVHYVLGAGTRLALEDAIALSAALSGPGKTTDLAAAFDAFEAERRPIVEERQLQAATYLRWHERAADRLHLSPEELVIDLQAGDRGDPFELEASAVAEAWRSGDQRIAGRVIDADGMPIEGAQVSFESASGDTPLGDPVVAWSDADGAFELQAPKDPGDQARLCLFAGSTYLERSLRELVEALARGGELELQLVAEVEVPFEVRLKLRSTPGGSPPGSVEVRLVEQDGWGRLSHFGSGDSITLAFAAAPGSRYRVLLIAAGALTQCLGEIEIGRDEELEREVTLAAGRSVAGRIVAKQGGAPVPNARVELPEGAGEAETDGTGRFALRGCVPEGAVLLTVFAEGFAPAEVPLESSSLSGRDPLVIELEPAFDPMAGIVRIEPVGPDAPPSADV